MFAMPGIILLVAAIYARPQEIVRLLGSVPLLHVFLALAVLGALLDLRLKNTRLGMTPILPWVIGFGLWTLVSIVTSSAGVPDKLRELAICVALYFVIGHAVQSFRGLGAVAGTVLAMVLLVSTVAVRQGFAPTGCIRVDESDPYDTSQGTFDGRSCTTRSDCYLDPVEPGAEYICEHIGWFGTTSVGEGRIRYRGVLQDPNELALAGAIGLPIAFAIERVKKRALARRLLLAVSFALILVSAVLTRSRGGQLVFLAVLAVPFARRFGVRGLALAGLLAAPVLVLGGRAGEEAASSSLDRVECWAEALSIWRAHPIFGAGLGQFGEYHYMTAHNSYLLTLAELGLPGMLLFTALIYVSLKVPIVAWRETLRDGSALAAEGAWRVVRPWAMAFVAAFAGLAVGIFFLSFAYHYVLWIYIGLSGALYHAIIRHDPSFRVRFGRRDLALVALIDLVMLIGVFIYTRHPFL